MDTRHRAAPALIACVLALVACTPADLAPPTPDMTLEQAKERTMRVEREIAALVPPENVAEITQNQTGSLFSCSMPEQYSWMGFLRVSYSAPADIESVLAEAETLFTDRDGYRVRDDPTVAGRPRVKISGLAGEVYFVHEKPDGSALEIWSYSPCVPLPEGAWPGSAF